MKIIVINNLLNSLEPLHYLDHHHVELQLCEPPPNAGPGSVFLIKNQILRVTFLTTRFQLIMLVPNPKHPKFKVVIEAKVDRLTGTTYLVQKNN